jgi:hypothetical protein
MYEVGTTVMTDLFKSLVGAMKRMWKKADNFIVLTYCVGRAVIAQRWAMGWTIGVLGFDSRRGLGIFLFTTASRTVLGPTHPPIQ